MGVPDRTSNVHLIINPRSGYGGSRQKLAELRSQLRQCGIVPVEYTTRAPEDATDYAQKVARAATAVVVGAATGRSSRSPTACGTDVPIPSPCRAGKENLLAKELQMPSDFAAGGGAAKRRRGRLRRGAINGQNSC
jgi:hypothetical protein